MKNLFSEALLLCRFKFKLTQYLLLLLLLISNSIAAQNIALNKPVWVSSVEAPGTNAKHKVNDGDYNTYWSSEFSDPQMLIIDLEQDYFLEELKIYWETAYSNYYQVSYSSNNSKYWHHITVSGNGGEDIINLQNITGRYLKIYFLTRATSWGNAIYEIEIYGQKVDNSINNNYDFDQNANSFQWINYGTQDWAVENAQVTSYRDGTRIVYEKTDWSDASYDAWCYYDNNTSKGKLYNWNAVMGIYNQSGVNYPRYRKEFAPEGWRVPSAEDWIILANYLISNGLNYDGSTSENKIAKAMASTTGWINYTLEGTPGNNQSTNNSSGFNAIPIGARDENGVFNNAGLVASFWTTSIHTGSTNGSIVGRELKNTSTVLSFKELKRKSGFSVRFVRDAQPLTAFSNNYSKPAAIYPNPTTSLVTIEGGDVYEIEVYSLQGRKLMTQKGNRIDLSALSNAMYLIKATNTANKQQQIYKVIKE